MDTPNAPSFIPKEEQVKARQNRAASIRRSLNLFFYLSILIFVLSLIALALAFLYRQYNESQLISSRQELAQAREQYDPDTVNMLNRFDTRLTVARNLLNNHVAFTNLFSEIEDRTLRSVKFDSFEASLNEGNIELTGAGIAQSYAALALQSDSFADSEYIQNPIFSNFSRDEEDETIQFDFSLRANPDLINYEIQ